MRGELTALRGFLDRRTPGYLVYFVTPLCNCRCRMCFNAEAIDNAADREVLTLAEVERVAQNFTGLHHLNLSGNYVYITRSREIVIVDVSDPAQPFATLTHDLPSWGNASAVGGDYVYVANGLSGLLIFRHTYPGD